MKQASKLKFKDIVKIKDDNVHWDRRKCFSYNCFYNQITGGRGIGKTTNLCLYGILNCDKGHEFIYVRRYTKECKEFVVKDSLSPILDGVIYKPDGTGGYTIMWEDRKLGYIIPLSIARNYKSVSFNKVTTFIYDEAIVMQTLNYRYLTNEVTQLLEFVSTVQRTRTNLKVFLLGNNEDEFSPYNAFFKIPVFERIYVDKKRDLYCEKAEHSQALLELEKKTGLWALTHDTSYGQYHYENKNIKGENYNICEKPATCRLVFKLVLEGETLFVNTFENKGDVMLYCYRKEFKDSHKDTITYTIVQNGEINYLDVDLFKVRLRRYLYIFYFNKKIYYDDSRSGAIIKYVIESI